jgi:5'-deoxynucleotidase YfbR-like HD superfamily hydrolase
MIGPGTPQRPRAWQRMLSGRRLDLLDPSPQDIAIEDIAHGLARVARWNGQTIGPHAFSVAQHSVLVCDIVHALDPGLGREALLAALLHDAPEYVIGDLISPFKAAIGFDYKTFENRLLEAIHLRFSLTYPLSRALHETIKSADRTAAYYEATCLAGFELEEARTFFGPGATLEPPLGDEIMRLTALPVDIAQARFLERFAALAPAAP